MGEDTGQNDRQTNKQTDTSTDNKGRKRQMAHDLLCEGTYRHT